MLALRAARTFLLTRRGSDLIVVLGTVVLLVALPPALLWGYHELGWWIGHGFELIGIGLVGVPVALDLHRGAQSRPLAGDLRATELVRAADEFLGPSVRALLVRLAEKDAYTATHTRRVALLAVQVGEELGLPPRRLRELAIGALMHDVGKLSVPDAILQKPSSLDDDEFAVIKRHPEWGSQLVAELGGFSPAGLAPDPRPPRAARRLRLPARTRGGGARARGARARGLRRLRRPDLDPRLPRCLERGRRARPAASRSREPSSIPAASTRSSGRLPAPGRGATAARARGGGHRAGCSLSGDSNLETLLSGRQHVQERRPVPNVSNSPQFSRQTVSYLPRATAASDAITPMLNRDTSPPSSLAPATVPESKDGPYRDRTCDLEIKSLLLYQLS